MTICEQLEQRYFEVKNKRDKARQEIARQTTLISGYEEEMDYLHNILCEQAKHVYEHFEPLN